jgi:hypothetical protein
MRVSAIVRACILQCIVFYINLSGILAIASYSRLKEPGYECFATVLSLERCCPSSHSLMNMCIVVIKQPLNICIVALFSQYSETMFLFLVNLF